MELPVSGMKGLFHNTSRVRLRTWLAIGYAMFIVYASLSPFAGWREQGLDFIEVLRAPFQLTYTAFDAVINLLSYLPFGLLAGLTLRIRFLCQRVIMGVALSASMEYQMHSPSVSAPTRSADKQCWHIDIALLAVSMTSQTWFLSA